jgi:nitrate reductase delta subunit
VTDAQQRTVCEAFSRLLSYPRRDVAGPARQALEALGSGASGDALGRFLAHVGATEPASLEELYTATFDLQPACAPYFGHQLLGDGPARGPLLARLVEVYDEEGFRPREELADHVAEVLGFLAVARPGPAREDLLRDGLLPAVARMIESFEEKQHPYRDLLVAVHAALAPAAVDGQDPAPAEARR